MFQFVLEDGTDPIMKLYELLIQLCTRPVKFDSTDKLINLYHRSAKWQQKANAFVDATSVNSLTKINPEEQIAPGKNTQ